MDLFTDMVAILNLLDLRSIMGCPGGTRSGFYTRFLGKKRTSLYNYFLGKRRLLLHPNMAQ